MSQNPQIEQKCKLIYEMIIGHGFISHSSLHFFDFLQLVKVAGDRQNIGRGVTFKSFIIILAV